MTNTVAIIQARMGSTRLPGKIMKKICGKKILEYVLERVKKAKRLNNIIVATTTEPQDDVIVEFCEEKGINYFRGSENDVLDRYYQCAKKYNTDIIVRLTSDCPLIDWNVIDNYIKYFQENDIDYVINSWFKNAYPSGFDVEVFSFSTLEKYWNHEKDLSKREHVCGYMKHYSNLFKCVQYSDIKDKLPYKFNFLHLSVDTKEDFQLVERIIKHFNGNINVTFWDILEYLTKSGFSVTSDLKEKITKIKKL